VHQTYQGSGNPLGVDHSPLDRPIDLQTEIKLGQL
jgi:hypothetical protein